MPAEPTPRPREHVEREPTGDRATPPEPTTRSAGHDRVTETSEKVEADERRLGRTRGVHHADQGPPPSRPYSVEQTIEEP